MNFEIFIVIRKKNSVSIPKTSSNAQILMDLKTWMLNLGHGFQMLNLV